MFLLKTLIYYNVLFVCHVTYLTYSYVAIDYSSNNCDLHRINLFKRSNFIKKI